MIRAVVDVNVLVSGFPSKKGSPAEIVARWRNQTFELVISEHIIHGIIDAWSKPYFRARFGAGAVWEAVDRPRARSTFVIPVDTVHGVADDEEDDLVLATAVAAEVPYLVTGDHGLQRLGRYGNITILSPHAFLEVLDEEAFWRGERG